MWSRRFASGRMAGGDVRGGPRRAAMRRSLIRRRVRLTPPIQRDQTLEARGLQHLVRRAHTLRASPLFEVLVERLDGVLVEILRQRLLENADGAAVRAAPAAPAHRRRAVHLQADRADAPRVDRLAALDQDLVAHLAAGRARVMARL